VYLLSSVDEPLASAEVDALSVYIENNPNDAFNCL